MPNLGINIPDMGIAPIRRKSKTSRKPTPSRPGVAGALFSATQQRVLGLVFGQPGRSFYATELIALAGGGSGAVQRELQRLAESGLVAVTRTGGRKHYRANAAAPIYAELRGIAVKILGPASSLRDALAPLAERLEAAWLHGSVAMGNDRADSDIDVLLVTRDAGGITLEEVFGVLEPAEKRLGRKVNPTLYTAHEFRDRRKNAFLRKVLAAEHVPLIGNADAV